MTKPAHLDASPDDSPLTLDELSPELKAAVFISVIKPYSLLGEQEIIEDVKRQIDLVLAGDLARPQAMLAGHAESLDAMFYKLLSQAQREKDPETVTALMAAAVKAQEACRSAIEGLATFKRLTTTTL
jgi:hypothetical protein